MPGAFGRAQPSCPEFLLRKDKRIAGLPIDPERIYWAETDPEQAEDSSLPYREVRLSGHVEGRFIYCTALSRHLVPFAVLEPAIIMCLWRVTAIISKSAPPKT